MCSSGPAVEIASFALSTAVNRNPGKYTCGGVITVLIMWMVLEYPYLDIRRFGGDLDNPEVLFQYYFVRKRTAASKTPSSLIQTFIWPVH